MLSPISLRTLVAFAVLVIAALAGYALLYHECEEGGAMASAHRTCTCNGVERVVLDQVAADGPRRSICLGLVTSRSCYRYRGGPQIECATP
jgi:hypothetical protein